ncbi:hypothetical protein [Phocaeicola sartorii]|uniref:hypothetical protein n=1 Tax=Phocaeicola sartorii TaxID=671267 RepID=UPI002557EB98|nr:hypothetical protein [Phocaeicola sartorii]
MPTYIRILTSLPDFIILTDEILTQYSASIFLEVRKNDAIINKRIIADDMSLFVQSNRDKNLHFYITTLSLEDENSFSFYDDALCKFVIEGRGGRENVSELEILELRIVSKTPDSIVNKISNAINSKLRKDIRYGSLTIRGNYKVFYNKADLGKKRFVYDIDNPLLPMIEIQNNVD